MATTGPNLPDRDPSQGTHPQPWAIVVALATIVAWYVVVALCLPHTLGDEMYHVPAIRDLAHGQSLGRELPMPPTFHWVVSWPARLVGDELWALRALQTLVGAATVLVFQAAARRLHSDHDARRVLLIAWNPLVLPFFALVYTDTASLLALLTAVYFQARSRYLLGAAALLLACLLRQSNLLWVVFFAAWRAYEAWSGGLGLPRPQAATGRRSIIRIAASAAVTLRRERLWLHALVLLAGAGFLLLHGRVVMAPFFENRPAFNPAQYYLFGLTMAVCRMPFWLWHLWRNWRQTFGPALLKPWTCAALVAAVGALTAGFSNPHPWNQELEFLHNWPLRAMEGSLATRLAAAIVIVVFGVVTARRAWRSPDRGLLTLIWGFSLLFLVPHYPADPRYYIISLVLLDLLGGYSADQTRRLSWWYLLLTVGVASFIAMRPGPYGGL